MACPTYQHRIVFDHISKKTGHIDVANLHAYLELNNPETGLGIPGRQDLEHAILQISGHTSHSRLSQEHLEGFLGRQLYGTPQNSISDLANPKSELNRLLCSIFTAEANYQHQICLLSQALTSNKFFDVEKVYDLLDRAKKGYIDIHDLVEFMVSLHGDRGHTESEILGKAELAFLRIDIDGDRKIGFRDWKSFLLGMKGSAVEESHKKNLHSNTQNFETQSRPVSGISQSQYNSNNHASSEYELRRTSEYSRVSNH